MNIAVLLIVTRLTLEDHSIQRNFVIGLVVSSSIIVFLRAASFDMLPYFRVIDTILDSVFRLTDEDLVSKVNSFTNRILE